MKTPEESREQLDCGRSIRKARKEKGWTQAQLADAIGVKRSVVSKYENGLIEPSISKLSKIEDALGVKFNERESSLNTLRDAIYEDAVAHGLWDDDDEDYMPTDCVYFIKDEVCELDCAAMDWEDDVCNDNSAFCDELSDVIIMCLSVSGYLGIDIDAAVRRKMEINKARPWKHGKEVK